MITDRSSSDEPYFAQRIRGADLVVLADGSPLHAKSRVARIGRRRGDP